MRDNITGSRGWKKQVILVAEKEIPHTFHGSLIFGYHDTKLVPSSLTGFDRAATLGSL
jgi:hypothetical protein